MNADRFPGDFRMKIRLLTANEGGRQTELGPGRMGRDLEIPGVEGWWSVWFVLDRTLEFGETRVVEAAPLIADVSKHFQPGFKFGLHEGRTRILDCEVLERIEP